MAHLLPTFTAIEIESVVVQLEVGGGILNIKKTVRNYLRPAKKYLKCSRRYKKLFYMNLYSSAKRYVEDVQNPNEADLRQYLGDPKTLIDDFFAEQGVEELRKSYRRAKWRLVITVLFVTAVLAGLFYWWVVRDTSGIEVYLYNGETAAFEQIPNDGVIT